MSVHKNRWLLAMVGKDFNTASTQQWVQENWKQTFLYSAIYLVALFGGQRFMKHRKAFELKKPLILWNLALATFSILASVRLAPSFFNTVKTHGLVYSICTVEHHQGPTGFWTLLFTLSKVPELFDTFFLVLRKRKVNFLHWFYHVTALICVWHSYKDCIAPARWFIMMNLSMNSVMYVYYTLRSLGIWFPKWIPMGVTLMQIGQMVCGCCITGIVIQKKLIGAHCWQPNENLQLVGLLYATYLVLLVNFFIQSYFVTRKFDKPKKTDTMGLRCFMSRNVQKEAYWMNDLEYKNFTEDYSNGQITVLRRLRRSNPGY